MGELLTIEEAARMKPLWLHPLGGSNFRTYWPRYRANRPYNLRSFRSRASALTTVLARTPFSNMERWRWTPRILALPVREAPVFIVGHWRSGTTHLHNLLSQDPQFGWISFSQTTMPWDMFGLKAKIGSAALDALTPDKREMDNVLLSIDSPQEEEMALGNMNPISFYNCYYFPREWRRHFERAILFKDVTGAERDAFAEAYAWLIRKLNFAHGGKRLLFKNPASTARLAFLKENFPGARFIHIVRNPFEVFASTLAHFPGTLKAIAWQKFEDIDFEELTFENYRLLMNRYLEGRELLEDGTLAETRFEDLVASPIEEVTRLYDELAIPGLDEALKTITPYVESQKNYHRNRHSITRAQFERVREAWGFALDHWGYHLPENLPVID